MVPGQPAARAAAVHAGAAHRESHSFADGHHVVCGVAALAVAAGANNDRRTDRGSWEAHLLPRRSRVVSRLANLDQAPGIFAFCADAVAVVDSEVFERRISH